MATVSGACSGVGEKELREGGIAALMGRWVERTMAKLPVVTERTTASAGGLRPKQRT
jgi:hypothetical protein